MNKLQLAPLFFGATLGLGGCAEVRHVQSVVPSGPENPCWHTVQETDYRDNEIINQGITSQIYSMECDGRLVKVERIAAKESLLRAQIEAASRLVVITSKQANDPVFQRHLLERLESHDAALRKVQRQALEEEGLSQEHVRSKVFNCDEVPSKDGGMTFHCN
ncbi:MAG: hypothetical protein DYH13_05550 [Alphaproteobacteria bacterium PRO2]|nr:hypothetical protein [Alphaproteobacteria bacterium PRO2]